jgi:hypothetical protein
MGHTYIGSTRAVVDVREVCVDLRPVIRVEKYQFPIVWFHHFKTHGVNHYGLLLSNTQWLLWVLVEKIKKR